MRTGNPQRSPDQIVGQRLKLTVAEPDSFARKGEDVVYGVVVRVLTATNNRGDPYEVAVVELERVLAYGVHSSRTVSLMTRYSGKELSDLSRGDEVVVNIVLEDSWILHGDVSDPRMRDKSLAFNLGFGTAALQQER